MGRIEYFCLQLNDGIYSEELREKLGTFFDIGVNCCGMRGQEVADILIASGLDEQLERQNPRFAAGMSGTEMLLWALGECGYTKPLEIGSRWPVSADYWVGYMLALFQIETGWRYRQVFARMSYADLHEMHSWCEHLSEREYVSELLSQLQKREQPKMLRRLRKAAGLTQAELAIRAGISTRTVQQYEDGSKDINKAAAITVQRLSLILGCRMGDLLEPPTQQFGRHAAEE